MKGVFDQNKWGLVSKELQLENLKLASYDDILIPLLGDLRNKKILDYGAGPGVLALALKRLGAEVKVWDVSDSMLTKSAEKIGRDNVYNQLNKIPKNNFDIIICNLVLCIVPEKEVEKIVKTINSLLKPNGVAYIGFCNPKILNIQESKLDLRYNEGKYEDNHTYRKIKKEGGYEILELHRPIEWYEKIYSLADFKIIDKLFTPEYVLNGIKIQDFIFFKLKRNKQ